ncbi:MAG: hypothetical protein U0573_15145 [Phycisphaerales bacterium]|nr:hypothetical protein [Planctomycetota bacterium]
MRVWMSMRAVAGGLTIALSAVPVLAQSTSVGPVSGASYSLQRQALGKLMKVMSVDYSQTRLESVIKNLADATGAPLDVLWTDDRNPVGLDKEALVTFAGQDMTALAVLEAVLQRAGTDTSGGGSSWQLTEAGTIEVGPKERLNRSKRLEIYDVSDLLLEIQDYSNVPQFDLNGALQAAGSGGGGGGGSSSPFSGTAQQNTAPGKTEQERADELIRLIVDLVEPNEWTNNGGSGASVRYYKKSLLVTAPDYIQRQINGYPFWPAEQTRIDQDKSGRRVTLLPPKGSGVVQSGRVGPSAPQSGAASQAPGSTQKDSSQH